MKISAWTIVTGIASVMLLAAFIVAFVLGPCTAMIDCNGTPAHMKCFWAYRAVDVTLACSVIMGALAATRHTKEGRVAAAAGVILLAASAIFLLSPAGIGTCGGAQMACNTHAVIVYALTAIAIVLCIVAAFKADPQEAAKPKMSL